EVFGTLAFCLQDEAVDVAAIPGLDVPAIAVLVLTARVFEFVGHELGEPCVTMFRVEDGAGALHVGLGVKSISGMIEGRIRRQLVAGLGRRDSLTAVGCMVRHSGRLLWRAMPMGIGRLGYRLRRVMIMRV